MSTFIIPHIYPNYHFHRAFDSSAACQAIHMLPLRYRNYCKPHAYLFCRVNLLVYGVSLQTVPKMNQSTAADSNFDFNILSSSSRNRESVTREKSKRDKIPKFILLYLVYSNQKYLLKNEY